MYNKSEIMKRAWVNYRSGTFADFASALKQSWATAKAPQKKIGWVKPEALTVGDTIKVETPWYTKVSKVISSIAPAGLGYAGLAIKFDDSDLKIFPNRDLVQRIA